jgi:glycosyltransferase involved in cell wall biosynthesis
MNCLLAMPWDQPQGGVTHVAVSLARSLEARGHRAVFLFPGEGWRLRSVTSRRSFPALICRLRDYPAAKGGFRSRISWLSTILTALPQLARFCRAQRIDLINVHFPGSGFALLGDLAGKLDIPLVVSTHGSDLVSAEGHRYEGAGLLRLLADADAVVAPSLTFLADVEALYPSMHGKSSYIFNGYDPSEFPGPGTDVMKVGGEINILCVAVHTAKKGIDVLLPAFRQIPRDDLRLRLVGDGPLRGEFEDLSRRLGLADRVTFVGSLERDELSREMRACDFFVLPSRSESFGLAALEAMACGKAVIASYVGGLRDFIENGVTGLSVPPDDVSALASAIDRVASDASLRRRLGDNARTAALRYTVDATADKYEQLFQSLIERRRRERLGDAASSSTTLSTRAQAPER